MTYNETIIKTKNWINLIQKSILFLGVIEAVIVIIIGVASSNIYHEKYAAFWIAILITLGIIYLFVTIIKIAYNIKFPASIIDELEAKNQLETIQKSIERKDAINGYISETIALLDGYECNCDHKEEGFDSKKAFRNEVSNGLKDLTEVFNRVLNVLLNSSGYKFTTGVYVDSYKTVKHKSGAEYEKGVFILRDDFKLNSSNALNNLMNQKKLKGKLLEIDTAITSSFYNGQQEFSSFDTASKTIICSNIKDFSSSSNQKGVLFIIFDKIPKLPNDLDSVLPVFTNIISHWLELYTHKVTRRALKIHLRD